MRTERRNGIVVLLLAAVGCGGGGFSTGEPTTDEHDSGTVDALIYPTDSSPDILVLGERVGEGGEEAGEETGVADAATTETSVPDSAVCTPPGSVSWECNGLQLYSWLCISHGGGAQGGTIPFACAQCREAMTCDCIEANSQPCSPFGGNKPVQCTTDTAGHMTILCGG